MSIVTEQTASDGVMQAVEYLSNRMGSKEALYFLGGGRVQRVRNGKIPTSMQFAEDTLADTLKRVLNICELTEKYILTDVEPHKVALFKTDIETLKQLLED